MDGQHGPHGSRGSAADGRRTPAAGSGSGSPAQPVGTAAPSRSRVLVAGADAARYLHILRTQPRSWPPLAVFGPAGRGRVAPDAVLLLTDQPDVDLPTVTGGTGRADRVLVVSRSGQRRDVIKAVRAGALGYLVRGEFDRVELVRAVRLTLAGGSALSRSAVTAVVDFLQCRPREADLSRRQQQILQRLAQGETNAAIAAHLGLSERTVRNYLSDTYRVLGVANRTEAVLHWLNH